MTRPDPKTEPTTSWEDRDPAWFDDAGALRDRARGRLHGDAVAGLADPAALSERGDHRVNVTAAGPPPGELAMPRLPEDVPRVPPHTLPPRAAAVLIPIAVRDAGLHVVLTQRSEALPSHAGQIAFPGGKVDPADGHPLVTALREAEEEIGLPRSAVEPIGFLDAYQTATGFRIQPVLALISPDVVFVPEPGEVAAVFEVPLAFLMDPANHRCHSAVWWGARRTYFAMPYRDRYIWGATAGILHNLHERLGRP